MSISLYQLGELVFTLEASGVPVPKNFEMFRISAGTPAYHYEFQLVDSLCWDRTDFQVHKDALCIAVRGGLETRYLCLPGQDHPYAVSEELDAAHTRVRIARTDLSWLAFDNVFCSLLSLERRMFPLDFYVLHSAYTVYEGQAILFTAPSGVGKSTQAELWEKHRGAHLINGDRSLLHFRDGRLYASGWPVCGSSGVCRNECYPVRAIVLLEQAGENRVDRLTEQEYTLRLMRELTINYHNPKFFDGALDFLSRLVAGADLRRLRCDISLQAVECLHAALYPDPSQEETTWSKP